MDPTRQIRLLISPFFFFASLISAFLSANRPLPITDPLALVGILTLSTLPIGFLIGTLAFLIRDLLWLLNFNLGTRLSEDDIDRIWPKLKMDIQRPPKPTSKKMESYIATIFDHGFLYKKSKGISEWLARVYNALMTCVSSLVALLLSYVIMGFLSLCPPWQWWLITVVIVILLCLGAWRARVVLLDLFELQTHRSL